MKTQYTPGPWTANGRYVEADPENIGDPIIVATCGMADSPKNDADARLIALAPEMADALRAIVTKSYLREGPHEDCHVHPALIESARSLLSRLD